MNPDIIAMGTGRTGTSTVARILHEHFKICMGHDFYEPTEGNPLGSYEDNAMMIPTKELVGFHPYSGGTAEDWLEAFRKAHPDPDHYRDRPEGCGAALKGVKNTHLSLLTLDQLETIAPKLIVRTSRPMEPTIKSLQKYRGMKEGWWRGFYEGREINMQNLAKRTSIPVCLIDYPGDRRLSDEEIVGTLEPYVFDALNYAVIETDKLIANRG